MLYVGGEFLVRNASKLAFILGWSPLLLGLTVVAFGTSAPELASTLAAALKGRSVVALGNVVGSNIANLSLVLGLAALISPLYSSKRSLGQEIPFMVVLGLLLLYLASDGHLGRKEALLLLSLLLLYVFFLFRRVSDASECSPKETSASIQIPVLLIRGAGLLVGIFLLSLGADILVEGAVRLAKHFGLSPRVIGLTLVALGTSLPELAGTLVAAYRRESNLILGNLIGSNIMNILAVLGVTIMVRPLSFYARPVMIDLFIMISFSLVAGLFLIKGLGRVKGLLLFGAYWGYIYLILRY